MTVTDIMGTDVRIYMSKKGGKKKRMAFSCVRYWKEECDGCGGCMQEEEKKWKEEV